MTRALVIRCDASPRLGIGHLMRCLVLADAWRAAGGRVIFAMAETLGHDRLVGHELASLAEPREPARVVELAVQAGARWVVVDHYELDDAYLAKLAAAGLRVLAIDDVAAHPFPVDVLVNPSVEAPGYDTAPHTVRLLGPRFALVRDGYRRARPERPLPRPLASVLVSFGGSDPDDRAHAVTSALAGTGLQISVILGPGYAGRVGEPHGVTVLRDLADLVEPMRSSQLLIGAGGSTAWEACCMGLPMILWPFVDNQRGLAAGLARASAAIVAGSADDVIAALDPAARLAGTAWDLVDGDGAARIVKLLT